MTAEAFNERVAALSQHINQQRSRKRDNIPFIYKPFSLKQKQILTWWLPSSPVHGKEGIIADGAIRSGKTVSMSLSYGLWAMHTFNQQNFLLCGKTIGSLRRNVVRDWKRQMSAHGYKIKERRNDNLLIVSKGEKVNNFYLFGGNTEGSQDLVQGITAAGAYFDEVALMPQSFVDQATGRCSVDGSKFWFNCNPSHPKHWFKTEWIDKLLCHKKENAADAGDSDNDEDAENIEDIEQSYNDLLYLHFTMDDNLSLSEKIKARYRAMYSGVFYNRFILGQWCVADGVIYRQFADDNNPFIIKREAVPKNLHKILIGIDWGDSGSAHSFVASGITGDFKNLVALASVRHKAKNLTPAMVEEKVVAFVKKIINEYGRVDGIFCDHINTFINGCRVALQKAGVHSPIGQANKCSITERIVTTQKLMGVSRFKVVEGCKSLIDAFNTAVWDSDHPDERLDDGTSDIDTLDGFEYSWSSYINMFSLT